MSKIYTTLESPVGLRKDLLNSNIEILEILEDFEKLKEIRDAKHKSFLFIQAYMREIHNLLVTLRMKFPRLEFSEEDKLKRESERINVEYEGYTMKEKEVNNLERELSVLREKLKDVSS
jgi:hypothetical protein